MRKLKQLGKQTIAALPTPVSLNVGYVLMWVLHPRESREFFRMQRTVYEKLGEPKHVIGGPFDGMPYISRATAFVVLPKLIGTYELELRPAIGRIVSAECDVLVDIGSAEGYYAVGLARRLPGARIVCYDILKSARYLLNKLARMNNVASRIEQRERCTPADLQSVLASAKRPAVICDCEGAEDFLLLPDQTPDLKQAMILVELHELMCPGVTGRIRARFDPTHDIESIDGRERSPGLVPEGFKLSAEEARFAMHEYRDDLMQWFFMIPRAFRPDGGSA